MRKFRNLVSVGLCALMLLGITPTIVYANSAQTHWNGMDAAGVVISGENGEDCPIMVEGEVLTFDIPTFPKEYYSKKEDYLAYPAKVTAEYTFYNPAEYEVTATLVFPFGNEPDYAFYSYGEKGITAAFNTDTEKYDILVNDQPVEKKIRHTLSYRYDQFELEKDMALLQDGYVADEFYHQDMTVTKYVYIVSGVDKETNRAANAGFDIAEGDSERKIYFVDQSGFHTQKYGNGRLSSWVENGEEIVIYVIGKPWDTQPEWKFYENGGVEDKEEIAGTMTYESARTKTMTLKEFALMGWSEETGVSESDWYNAVIAEMKEDEQHNSYGMLSLERFRQNFSGCLMRWYEYEITLAPDERLVNTVTAPIYPGINLDYEPPVYYYTYLLSPAKTWVGFGELQIVIRTPYYVTDCSLGELIRTENGDYMMFADGLPGGELEFTMSESAKPERSGSVGSYQIGELLRPVIFIAGIGICIVVAVGKLRKKKKE